MPAILRNVAKTDTLETQRQKINQIASDVYTISSGGSDLSTGNLKLGDGTISSPSLAFVSDEKLGIYKPSNKVIGIVSDDKKLLDFKSDSSVFYRDIVVQKKSLDSLGLQITNDGSNYDAGTYSDIAVVGGSGENGTLNIEVAGFTGTITNTGSGYTSGSYLSVPLSGGSGNGATASFTIPNIGGSITNAGSGYVGGTYTNVPLTGGTGTGITANITVSSFSANVVNGAGYPDGTFLSVPLTGGTGSGAKAKLIVNGGSVQPFGGAGSSLTTAGSGYIVGDVLTTTFPTAGTITYTVTASGGLYYLDGVQGGNFSLLKGKTYVFDASGAPGHPLYIGSALNDTNSILGTADGVTYRLDGSVVTPANYLANFATATTRTVTFVVPLNPAASPVYYNCSLHPNMGGSLTLVTSTTGSDFAATITALSGTVSSVAIQSSGNGYSANDVLSAANTNLGGSGSGFQYTLAANAGQIQAITTFDEYGTGYQTGDVLTLPSSVNNVSTYLKGIIFDNGRTLNSASTTVTLTTTTGVFVGDTVETVPGNPANTGALVSGTTVASIVNGTQITLSSAPQASGTADLKITNANRSKITVTSTSGIKVGWSVSKVSGTGVLANGTSVTAIDSATVLTLSQQPTTPGNVVLDFTPSYGNGSNFAFTLNDIGPVKDISVNDGGNGYSVGDILTVSATDLIQPIEYTVTNKTLSKVVFTSATLPANTFAVGQYIKTPGGSIGSAAPTSATTIAGQANASYTNITPSSTSGNGIGAVFSIFRNNSGAVTQVSVTNAGVNYAQNDTVTVLGTSIGGSAPADNLTITVTSVTVPGTDTYIYEVNTSGGYVTNIVTGGINVNANSYIVKTTSSTLYQVASTSNIYRYFIDTGSGEQISPDLTFYVGNTYKFNLSDASNSGHIFALSKFRDGRWAPSLVQNISTNVSALSPQVTVSSTTGLYPGMIVEETGLGNGQLASDTKILTVDSGTQITLDKTPITSGSITLKIYGGEYTDGVTRETNPEALVVKVTSNTPSLYYYCGTENASHADEGGFDNDEAVITIDPNNPKTFGSGLQIVVTNVTSSNVIETDLLTGELSATIFTGTNGTITNLNSTSFDATTATIDDIISPAIASTGDMTIDAGGEIKIAQTSGTNVKIGTTFTLGVASGNLTTTGVLKTTNSLNVNDYVTITNNTIASSSGNDIIASPASGRVLKVNTNTALTIPAGSTAQRPTSGVVSNGSIRFNTDTGQYEGYSASTSSWSSLGGVRDLDGNTYISAEASVGANDNTLYFFNDGNNTVKITPSRFTFNTLKYIDSPDPLNPPSVPWSSNTPVSIGTYISYGLNLYQVTTAGTTGSSGNEPTHTTGVATNGTAQLTWYSIYASDITFDRVANVNIKNNLVLNGELKLFDNKITTLLSDLVLEPFSGKKVDINTNTSLVLPNGTTAQRGIPGQGSVRYNTDLSQFEGYNGTNWTSLGGVRDVDGNTYIIPETEPGANENTLYFYNNGSNTLRLNNTELLFNTIDQIGSTNNNLDLQAQTVTFNSLAVTLDTSDLAIAKFLTTKTNLDFALSSGLTTDPLIRLNNSGDIYINKTYGTGTNTLIKVLDNELKKFEMDDVLIQTSEYTLTKGTTNSGASVIFDPTIHSGAKVAVIADNTTTNHRDMIEFTVIAKGTDIFHTEYGNVTTGVDLIIPSFDFDASNNVRLNNSLVSSLSNGNIVNITVVSTVIKK